jgi:hypothetical protein
MHISRLLSVPVFILMICFLPVAARSQETTPEPGPTAAESLPPASALGNGWTQATPVSPDILAEYSFTMSPDVFSEGAAATYLGPNGSRVLIVNLIITDNRVAIRKSWEDATSLLDAMSFAVREDYEQTENLETMTAPKGCVEAKRKEGIEQGFLTPYAATMCAIDPDRIMLVIVSGTFEQGAGVEASDAIMVASLE